MKKKLLTTVIITVAIAGGITINNIFASSATPGGSSDPLVSKSYVDAKFNELAELIKNGNGGGAIISGMTEDQILAGVMDQLEIYYAGVLTDSGKYVPVFAETGQIILGGEGTEIILRSGSAKGYIAGSNGIVNASDGTEIFNNDNIKINNLLIIPREDGRGVAVQTDAWFIIKGDYTVLN